METLVSPPTESCDNHHQEIKLSTDNRNKLITELLEGQKCANQLHLLLHKPSQQQQQQQQDLLLKILTSFTQTLSVVTSSLQLQLHANASSSVNDSPNSADDRRSEDSGRSNKTPPSKDRRGCYKRKKNLQTWTVVSSSTEDAHAWRKYGQKEILNAKHPRSYFRCRHKYDQGCRATKQVQRTDNDPQMFETTYIGNHTCTDLLTAPKIIISESFDHQYHPHPHPWPNTTPTPTLKIKQEITCSTDDLSDNLSSLDSVMWDDLVPFDSSDAAAAMASDNYGDHHRHHVVVSSSSTVYDHSISSHSFEVDLEREFHFNETAELF